MSALQPEAAALQLLLDERGIRATLHRCATALDLRDWALLATCYAPDATAFYENIGLQQGYPEIEGLGRRALRDLSRTQHLISNTEIAVDGDGAVSTAYVQAQHVRPGVPGGDSFTVAGRYLDDWVRSSEGWRIRHRRMEVWWTAGNPAVFDLPITE